MEIPEDALCESWEGIYGKSVALARAIESHCRETGEAFDVMIVVPRGSYYPANIVSRELGFGATDLLHACIGTYAEGTTQRTGKFELGQMPADEEINGRNLLIIEEVCDKGQALKFLTDRLKNQSAGLIRTGVLYYKPGQSETGFKPDWYMGETDKWIVFPWELNEQAGFSSVAKRKLSAN